MMKPIMHFRGDNRTKLIDNISKNRAIQRYFTATPTQELLSKMDEKVLRI